MNCSIREIREDEIVLLDDFLYEAIYIPPGYNKPVPRDIIYNDPLIYAAIRDFGKLKDDYCFVAEVNGKVIGAVWAGIRDEYGHVDNKTPSFSISLYREYRGQGIGTQLMSGMLKHLKLHGYKQASLGVSKKNQTALKLYRKAGFRIVGNGADTSEWLMLCDLEKWGDT